MSNEFKLFGAGGSSPNTLSPSAWAALTTLLGSGFASGVADSKQFNTLFRQCSTIAAVIGQFISDNGQNAVDDGTIATTLAALKTALQTAQGNRVGHTYATTDWTVIDKAQGLYMQFGVGIAATGNGDVVTMPLTFPNQNLGVLVTDAGATPLAWGADTITPSTFKVYGRNSSGYASGFYRYVALGR